MLFKLMLCVLLIKECCFKQEQESRRAYGTADEALSTTLVMFEKMFLF